MQPSRPTLRASTIDDDDLRDLIRSAVRESVPVHPCLNEDELTWVRIAIRREAQRIEFRQAVVEKTLLGLIWAGVIALGVMVREYFVSHGLWRP